MDKLLERYVDFINQDEEDRIDAVGRDIVNRVIGKYGTTNIERVIKTQENLEIWKKIAFRKFSPFLQRETISVREIRERLGELKKAQYPVNPNYRGLGKKELWAYFRQTKRNIRFYKHEQ